MGNSRYPVLYQINTRVWLTELSGTLGRRATLDDIPDAELDRLAERGFDWIWLLSVWQTGSAAQEISRNHVEWQREFQETLPDLRAEDIAGSGFAITGYTVHTQLGGDAALARLRARLRKRNLKLMLDFVPNHMGISHPWVDDHPEYFVHGSEIDQVLAPQNYTLVKRRKGDLLLAYGRDPYFSGWPDTLQLNYANPATQEAMIGELVRISGQCDGVRCDMAMLVLPDVFDRTWGHTAPLFWPAAIQRVRDRVPNFLFMAEVYWDMEWTLQQQGFDYAYDKRLYDRLREGRARPVREHFHAGLHLQGFGIGASKAVDKLGGIGDEALLLFVMFLLLLPTLFSEFEVVAVLGFVIVNPPHGDFDGAGGDCIHKSPVVGDDYHCFGFGQ